MKVILPYWLILLGIIILIFTIYKLFEQKIFINNSNRTIGKISGYEYSDWSREQLSNDTISGFAWRVDFSQASPIITFTTSNWEIITFTSSTSTEFSSWDDIQILYNLISPNKAQIDDFFSLWWWIYLIGLFGIIFCIVGVSLRFLI